MAKYIFVTGGVVSGLGKGITASSIGRLLKSRGINVTSIKIDPYLNIDAGTMNPFEHGEVYVLDDGGEVDLDLGNYERFMDLHLGMDNNITTGKVYRTVIENERRGEYLGKTVQIIPHITNEIKRRITAVARQSGADVAIVELGGTVGDIESMPFLEAARQLGRDLGREENVMFIHTTLIPIMGSVGEEKSKPTQHSVKELLSIGIQPDILVCRTDAPISDDIRRKIALFCNVEPECVIQNATASTLYEAPLLLEHEGLSSVVCRRLGLDCPEPDLAEWKAMVGRIKGAHRAVKIALVGKYVQLHDAYLSVAESLNHAAAANDAVMEIKWVDSEELTEENIASVLGDCSGILVPGGFGDRGIEGMILAAKYARENDVPYLGICLGLQIAVIEFARHVLGWKDANSAEFTADSQHLVIDLMPEQQGITAKGGTMRLGKYPCVLSPESKAYEYYGEGLIYERHRHRYEVNNDFREEIVARGLLPVGMSPDGSLVEMVENPACKWFVAAQFHPEFKSRPNKPHPLFNGFVKAALER